MSKEYITIDGNEAVAYVAYRCNEVVAIYPITPSSNMGEWADEWSALGRRNIWGTIPLVPKLATARGVMGASAPPATAKSDFPARISWTAADTAFMPAVQAVANVWTWDSTPRNTESVLAIACGWQALR